MHFQRPEPNWPEAAVLMPDYSVFKSIIDRGILRDAKNLWRTAGRNPAKLFTVLRHDDMPGLDSLDFEAQKQHWRLLFRSRYFDGTTLREFLPYIDAYEERNEYFDSRGASNPAYLAPFLTSARAAVSVWNNEIRGRVYINELEQVEGFVPASARLVIGNVAVGNAIPREFYELAEESDNILGAHLYMHVQHKVRDTFDFRFHSGRVFYEEAIYDAHPHYIATESSPYAGSFEGWRHPACIGNSDEDEALMVRYMADWFDDLTHTTAYREGRIIGPGCWFTSGESGWPYYSMQTRQLTLLARILAELWHPAPWFSHTTEENDMLTEEQRTILIESRNKSIQVAAALDALLVEDAWWKRPTPYVVKVIVNPLVTYQSPNGPIHDIRPNVTYDLIVQQVQDNWLRVAPPPGLKPIWVKAQDVRLKELV